MLNNGRNGLLRWLWRAAHSGPTLMELVLAITALRWGVFILLPPDVLENARSDTIVLMSTIAPLGLWALLFLALGLAQGLYALSTRQRPREVVAFVAMLWWLGITVLDLQTGLTAGTIAIAVWSFAEWGVFTAFAVGIYDAEITRS
jgi:hypothetical protein